MLFDVKNCKIHIARFSNARLLSIASWNNAQEIPFTKYQIKESDLRTKTATFTSNYDIDLTTGLYIIRISSIYHENFGGIILSKEYDETTGLINYQCQDWSRKYQNKTELIFQSAQIINILRSILSGFGYNYEKQPTEKDRQTFKGDWSGLKAVGLYEQSLYSGNIFKGNFMKNKPKIIIRDKTDMEVIRALTFGQCDYVDVWFNDRGVLNITPLSRTDWYNTGLVLSANTSRSFKFDTTNAITGGIVSGEGSSLGKGYESKSLINLDLSAFFGNVWAGVKGHTNDDLPTKSTGSKTTTSSNKYGNPFNNKKKKVWINADNGSNSKKNDLVKALKNDGWSVHTGATDSNAHYRDYWNVTKDYSVYITLYNGFCAGTIREAYSSKIQNALKKKGVQLVPIWDSAGWTNPKGMKPYRNGDFSKYSAKRAWDDNFSGSDPSIKNVGDFFKKHKATYCVGTSTSAIMQQFRAGGYFAYKGIKV